MLGRKKIILCLGSSCFARGNDDIIPHIKRFISRHELDDKVEFRGDHCFSNCSEGPNLMIGSKMFSQISVQNIDSILEEGLQELL
jgi:NADH:ubiquinone oxidoreductase subunit E